ncbi:hypothetical protein Glove_207g23 [Diversispora epigaea]|uniref:Uncharacterized protein n=1 Tax=Diversispora epigaea TaxID=1348612 RepID=A0A397ISI5_9GLOM|nr:hypothetical protein Glove_207g23 [Diversispora epigaea]
MPCNWLLVSEIRFCENQTKEQYCASHAFKIRNGVIIPEPCKGCGRGTKSSVQLCVPCGQGKERAYRYYKHKCEEKTRLLEQMEFLSDLSYPAMIPPIDIMENRPDIYRKRSISIETYRNLFQAMYVKDLAEFLKLPDAMDYYYIEQMEFLSDLSYPAMIPPIDIMENRPDIYRKRSISIETYRNLFQAM